MATKIALAVYEVIEFPINTGLRVAADQWPGVLWKYAHRYTEELRDHYRAKFGRGNYRVKIEKRRCEHRGRHIARIVVMAP